MLDKFKEAIASNIHDGMLYLVDRITDCSGLFLLNGHLLYVIENFENISHISINTEKLHLNSNIEIISFAATNYFKSGRYNVIELLPSESGYIDSELESFINLCSAHSKYMQCRDFMRFFYSLISMFQYPKDQQFKNLIGLFGELVFIEYIYNNYGVDCSDRWHISGTNDKYDFVFDEYNMEIKTSKRLDDCVTVKHSQIFNYDNNYLVIVRLEENNSGRTLYQLIKEMINNQKYCNNYNFIVNIEKEKKRVSHSEAAEIYLSLIDVKIYKSNDVNPFKDIPNNISNLTYNIDLSSFKDVKFTDM